MALADAVQSKTGSRGWAAAMYVYAAAFFCFLYLPLTILVVLSFNDSSVVSLPFERFTVKWYGVVFTTPQLFHALLNSLLLGVVVACIATALALTLGLGFRREFRLKPLLLQIILVPIIVPGIIGGIMLLISFGYLGVRFNLATTVLVAHVNWVLPFAFLTLYPRLHRFDRSIEEAAMDLGARPFTVFRRIVLPLIKPGILATLLFSFTLSFDEFIRTVFVIGTDRTIPVHLWSIIIENLAPYLPAVGVIIMAISSLASLFGFVVSSRSERKPKQAVAGG